jgi:hypothetical protein
VVKDDFACPDDNHFTILDRFADRRERTVQRGAEDDGREVREVVAR